MATQLGIMASKMKSWRLHC
ncbi:uncharacterized protein G2W53_018374 [Senna tora]|uniref:Uncharacterized protein n=1 Tax=Senna tora TaxID=362788 RepID=A0A834TVT9_9FABA|nr:uncharacterized protein G2W53_018364 [Senna tora]KAF7827210.1 uncharacterized protein G2W53_018374 [Senna tora]